MYTISHGIVLLYLFIYLFSISILDIYKQYLIKVSYLNIHNRCLILNIYIILTINYDYDIGVDFNMKQFKPVKEEKEVISLRISTNLIKELDEKANIYDMSRNELIVQSICFALENIDNVKPTT